jgi:hypothetical protein
MATSTPASANSPANISPVGPPPAFPYPCLDSVRASLVRAIPVAHQDRPPRSTICPELAFAVRKSVDRLLRAWATSSRDGPCYYFCPTRGSIIV